MKLYVLNVLAVEGRKARLISEVALAQSEAEAMGLAFQLGEKKFGELNKPTKWSPAVYSVPDEMVACHYAASMPEVTGATKESREQVVNIEASPEDDSEEKW